MGKWEMVWLGDVCDVLNGFAFQSTNYISNGHRVIRITNVQKGAIVDDDPKYYNQSPALDKYELYDNDLLMSLTGNVGRVGLISENMLPAYLNQRVACLREKTRLLSKKFLYFYLNADDFERDAINSSKGLAQKNMSTEWLKNYAIPLPPLPVQRKIADVLDRASALIEKRKAQIDKLNLLVKSQFIEMFGDPVANPRRWPIGRLSDLAEIKIGPFGSLLHAEDYVEDKHALVNPSHIEDNVIVPDRKLTVSDGKFQELSSYALHQGDIVLGRRGEMGRCAVVQQEGLLCGTGSLIIRPYDKNMSFILQKIISYPTYRQLLVSKAVGITMHNLNVPIVSSLEIPILPLELQNAYMIFVHRVEEQKSLLHLSLIKVEQNYKFLMQKCFRGEIF